MQQVPLTTPIKGVVRTVPREGQPPETCWDALNVLPYDRYGRRRLAQRAGLLKQYPNQMSDNFVQGMLEAPNIVYPPGTLTIPAGGLSMIPGFPASFTTPGTTGPLAGPLSTIAFAGGWSWTFTLTGSTGTSNIPVTLLAVFSLPTTTDVVNPYGIVLYVDVQQNGSSPQFGARISYYEGLIASAPVPDSTPHLPVVGTATLLSFPSISNQTPGGSPGQALWVFHLDIDAGGNMTLFDVTDSTDSTAYPLTVTPTVVPLPSLVSATYYDASMSSDAVFTITD